MKKNFKFPWSHYLLVFVGLLSISSCKILSKKDGAGDKASSSTQAIIKALDKQAFKSDWMDARARISFKNEDMSVSGSATIRMKKDSLLWISVKKLGFEVARAMITRDSVLILDRINNEYGRFGLSYLSASYNLPANFGMVQSVVLGKPYFVNPTSVRLEESDQTYALTDQIPGHQVTYSLDRKDLRLLGMKYRSALGDQELIANLSEYAEIAKQQNFSYFRDFRLEEKDDSITEVTIKFSQIDLDTPQDIPFSIPRRYKRMEE